MLWLLWRQRSIRTERIFSLLLLRLCDAITTGETLILPVRRLMRLGFGSVSSIGSENAIVVQLLDLSVPASDHTQHSYRHLRLACA